MADRSIRCALWLKSQGVKPSDIIGLSTGNHLDAILPIISSLLIGSIINPWWDDLTEEELIKYFIDLTQTKIVFISEANAKLMKKVVDKIQVKITIIVFGKVDGFTSFEEIIAIQKSQEVLNFKCTEIQSPDQPAIILYTSGTTGNPKGVVLAYKTLGNNRPFIPVEEIRKMTGINFSTVAWISGVMLPLTAIEAGAKMIIFYGISEPESFQLIDKYKAQWITMGTGVANRMSKDETIGKHTYPSVKWITFGGACVKKRVVDFLKRVYPNARICQAYGSTESGGPVTCSSSDDHPDSCGKAVKNMEIKIVDEDGNIVLKPNVEGELCMRSSTMMISYYKNPQATAAAVDSDGWFHSGDLGHYNENGEFFITDRIRELIKYRLHHVPPAPIEEVIQKNHPGVYEVAVVRKPHNEDVEQPMAFVIKMPGVNVTEEEIIDIVDKNMSERFKLRGGVKFVNDLPRTSSGKVAKKILRDMAIKIALEESK
ncbi:4-coumarate--CoA ligase 1-like isoform X2 [Chelonus insularis]|nr:4-coumarate--CoA ligase 1-like isoform X2 [Chelonus insularis]